MEEIEKLVADLTIKSVKMDKTYLVEVTYIIDPFDFYVRPMKYRPLIHAWETTEPKTKTTIFSIHDMVIFNYGYSCGARKYMRGRIIRISQIECYLAFDVFAIDYGFTEKLIPIENVWVCSHELKNTPALAFDCQLANCYPIDHTNGFTSEAIHAFKYYAGIESLRMKVLGKKPHKILVELVNSTPESIATLLAISGFSILGFYHDPIVWNPIVGCKIMYFDFKKLTIGETLHVRVQSGESLNEFHVATVSDYNKHVKEIDIITFYARREFSLSPEHLIEGTLVCVKIENRNIYERAFIKKVTKLDETAIVQLVDWGRDEEFHIGKMKYMSSQCLRTPVLSIYCKSEENQVWDNGYDNFLTPGFEFNITIKSLGHQFECPNTVDISPVVESDDDDGEARALPINVNE
ncbi:uncharacterized protein LOC124543122 [Vanessa cardui]|uniref:uncharacterized protein LOC124543122 n=1 Tax=Vanessa cardui TaxID=171605 RepID=UPI001F13E04F|nr:uncharacterized protein LOC124543122 [Vanessa cardui]